VRDLLGQLPLEPTHRDVGWPYYIARMSLNTLALLDTPLDDQHGDIGSSSLRYWRRRESNRLRLSWRELPVFGISC